MEPSGNYAESKVVIGNEPFYYQQVVRRPSKHKTFTTRGITKGIKHKTNRKDLLLKVIFPAGILSANEEVRIFEQIAQAQQFIRANVEYLKDSTLRSIGGASRGINQFARNPGCAYGLIFININKGEN